MGKTEQAAEDLIAQFNAAATRRHYFGIVENKAIRSRVDWLRENRPPLFDRVNAAMSACFQRTVGTDGDGPPDDKGEQPPMDEEAA